MCGLAPLPLNVVILGDFNMVIVRDLLGPQDAADTMPRNFQEVSSRLLVSAYIPLETFAF